VNQLPLRPDSWTEVTFDDGEALDWNGDLLVIGLHTEAIEGARMHIGCSILLYNCTGSYVYEECAYNSAS